MTTVLDILHRATMLTGMRASGEELDAFLTQDCLDALNMLVDGWALEELLVYTMTKHVIPGPLTTQTYTIGPGGNLNIPRPVRLEEVKWRDASQVPALEHSLRPMTAQQYHGLWTPELTSTLPLSYYYEPTSPLGTLFVHPKPAAVAPLALVVWVWNPWVTTSVDQLTDPITFPPGYERFLVHQLAVELGQQPGARLTPQTIKIAAESKLQIEQQNNKTPVLQLPVGLFRRRQGSYSYYEHVSNPG
jgi:hypothetical protein